jgi:hypothetical protein
MSQGNLDLKNLDTSRSSSLTTIKLTVDCHLNLYWHQINHPHAPFPSFVNFLSLPFFLFVLLDIE